MRQAQHESGLWSGLLPLSIFLLAGGLLGDSGVRSSLSASGLGFLDDPRRLLAYGSSYLLALIWLMGRSREATELARGLWPWWLLIAYALISMSWSRFPMKIVVNFGHYTGETLVALAAVMAVRGRERWLYIAIAVLLSIILIASFIAIRLGLPGTIDPDSSRWAGTVANANHLGLMSAIQIGTCVYLLMSSRGLLGKIPYLLAICIGVVLLRGSGSATALVVTLIFATGMIWMMLGRNVADGSLGVRIAIGCLLMLTMAIMATLLAPTLLRVETGLNALGRSETLTGRTDVWAYGWEVFQRRPWLGFSFDSLASVLVGAGNQVGHFHNGFLDLLVRGGIVGGLLYLTLLCRTLGQSFKQASQDPYAVYWLVLLGAQLVYETVESSIARPVHFLWFLILVGMATVQPRTRALLASAAEPVNSNGSDHSTRTVVLPNLLR